MKRTGLLILGLFLYACSPKKIPESPDAWKKISLDFKSLDADGLSGGPKAKVEVNYEFCIPRDPKKWKEVRKIDQSARKNAGKGRLQCKDDQWLVIGSTHQKGYQRVLFQLASLPYVDRIQQVFWE